MKILGIETSCDEIAASVVKDGTTILSNEIASSVDLHKKTGGIIPEIAARDAAVKIMPIITNALNKANCNWDQIDAIAITNGPGLAGSLLVGIETARTLAMIHHKPLIPVHHIVGHIFSNIPENQIPHFPALVLTVSGGHNDLILWEDILKFQTLGETHDDSAGEAFDKVAKMLSLSFPGGPEIAALAENGNRQAYNFPRPMAHSGDYNFSYSGIKTAVLYTIHKLTGDQKNQNPQKMLTKKQICDLAASFEEAVVDSLCNKLFTASENYDVQEIYLAGGVSANQRLKFKINQFCQKNGKKFIHPSSIRLCTDNAAMIASAGYFIFKKYPAQTWNWRSVKLNLNFDLPQFQSQS